MSYFKTCPHCGAHLDSGEVCDCTLTQVCAAARETFPERFTGKTDREVVAELASVVKRAAQGATNTQDGETEHVDHAVSASIINETEEKVK